jgi:hypothetical protein
MIRSKGLDACLLGFLVLLIGCASPPKKILAPGSLDDLRGCYAMFPGEPWESVHRIEATMRGGGSFSLLGVTKGEPSERRLQSLLLTPEGFILFDAEQSEAGIVVQKAVAPFDSPDFASGLMEDVSLLFLPPQGKPMAWAKETDGTMICNWEDRDDSRTEISGSIESGWRILRRNKKGKVVKKIVLNGPFVNGLASRVELRAFKPAPYRLKMTLLQPSP